MAEPGAPVTPRPDRPGWRVVPALEAPKTAKVARQTASPGAPPTPSRASFATIASGTWGR